MNIPADLGRILGVWAHPDDEAFTSGGIMAAAVRAGQEVFCLTATRGEGGSLDHERWPPEKMGEVREEEMMHSLEILGVHNHRWLGYIDGTCSEVPLEEGVAHVRAAIEEFAPDSILTFGPDGITNHPDHRAVCAWATNAFEASGKPGSRLFYVTTTAEWVAEWGPKFARFNVFPPGFPVPTDPADLAFSMKLSDEMLDIKKRALEAHKSQLWPLIDEYGAEFLAESESEEHFRLGAEK